MGEDSRGVLSEAREETDGEQWEEVDSSDEETFFLDPYGRVPFAGEVQFGFRSSPEALASALSDPEVLARVVADCQAVFSTRAKKLAYSTGETFWMQADKQPRNSLEALALEIFRAHTSKARFNQATSGAEWWTQVIEDTDDIGWHWDKDYGMEAQGINVYPCLATVTYLSTNGGPTVILEKQGPMVCEDVDGVSGAADRAWISRPRLGKHICFDGRYLHAAPADLASQPDSSAVEAGDSEGDLHPSTAAAAGAGGVSSGNDNHTAVAELPGGGTKRAQDGEPKTTATTTPPTGNVKGKGKDKQSAAAAAAAATRPSSANSGNSRSSSSKRVTFLVNVWLNHAPKMAAPLPEDVASSLTRGQPLAANLSTDDFVAPTILRVRPRPAEGLAGVVGGTPSSTNGAAAAIERGGGGGGAGSGGDAELAVGSRTVGATTVARSGDGEESEGEVVRGSGAGDDGGVVGGEEKEKRPSEEACSPGCIPCPCDRGGGCGGGGGGSACTASAGSFVDNALAGDNKGSSSTSSSTCACGTNATAVASPSGGGDGGLSGSVDNLGEAAVGGEDSSSSSCCGGVVVDAVDMRWEFGEVGDKAEEQVHLRHEVVVPVPTGLLVPAPAGSSKGNSGEPSPLSAVAVTEARGGEGGGDAGGSFRVEYYGSRKPRVARVAGAEHSSESESSAGEGEEEDEDDD